MRPMKDRERNIHTSYHRDGKLHMKSGGRKVLKPRQRQPLTGPFKGTVDLGIDWGFTPNMTGEVCDPNSFSGIVEIEHNILGPKIGVGVALVEPGHEPPDYACHSEIVAQKAFVDVTPNVVIAVLRNKLLDA